MYFVTVLTKGRLAAILGPGASEWQNDPIRTVGFFSSPREVLSIVQKNELNIQDGVYELCVIEEIREGLYESAVEQVWYEWNELFQRWNAIDAPEIVQTYGKIEDHFVPIARIG